MSAHIEKSDSAKSENEINGKTVRYQQRYFTVLFGTPNSRYCFRLGAKQGIKSVNYLKNTVFSVLADSKEASITFITTLIWS